MYTIGIKGKGYYSGLKNAGGSKRVNSIVKNTGDDFIKEVGDVDEYELQLCKIRVTIPMKRSIDDIDNQYIFKTKEDAQKHLERLKNTLDTNDDRSYSYPTRTSTSWGGRSHTSTAHSSQTRYDKKTALKTYPQLEILEDELTLKKKTRRNHVIYTCKPATARGTSYTCQFCNIEISDGEPYYSNYKFNLCFHCIQQMFNDLKPKFDACTESEDWTTAWVAEKVTREI